MKKKRNRIVLSFRALFVAALMVVCGCNDETKVKGVSVNPEEMTMQIGETRQIELTIEPTSAAIYNPKYWSSSDENVAIVDGSGNVTAVYAGTCVITASVDGHKATCTVTVETPKYNIKMSKGTVYITGMDSETGAMTQVLRLYDEGLEMDKEGNVTGNGLMINLALCSAANTDTLTEGRYTVEQSHREGTVKPGEFVSEGRSSYVTGSFLGQYTDNGLTVLLLTGGEVEIKRNTSGEFEVTCDMEGAQMEQVKVQWSGTPARYRADTVAEATQILYSDMVTKDTVIANETATRHTHVTLSDGQRSVGMVFRLPLSATGQLLAGRYEMSADQQSFTIMDEGCTLTFGGKTVDIQNATITVSNVGEEFELSGSFRSEEGYDYVIERCGKKDKKTWSIGCKIQKKSLNLQPNYEQ